MGGCAQRIDQIAHCVGGGCEDKVAVYVDEAQSAEDSGDLDLLLHGVSAIARIRARATEAAVSSVFAAGVSRSAGDTRGVGVGVDFTGFFLDEADGCDSIDLVAFVGGGLEFESERTRDGRKEFMDAGLVLEFEDLNPRRPDGAFGVVEEDGEIFSEGAESLVDGSVEEGAFDANDILHEVSVELWGELFE